MNNFPERLLDIAISLWKQDPNYGRFDESVKFLDVDGIITPESWQTWKNLISEADEHGVVIVIEDEFATSIESVNEPKRAQVRIHKPNTETSYHAFAAGGVKALLASKDVVNEARAIFVASELEPFSVESCIFDRWVSGTQDIFAPDPLSTVEPRRLVYETVPGTIPRRIGFLLLKNPRPQSSTVFDLWKRMATRYLAYVIVDEVRAGIDEDTLIMRQTFHVAIDFKPATVLDDTLLERELEVARWIYAEGAVENRHAFFATELARLWPVSGRWETHFAEVAPRALQSAKSANNLLISEKSSDALKSLADLRKNMTDDVARVTAQIRDLNSGLWRDFFIAVSAILARIALPARQSFGTRLVLLLAAAFLVYSCLVTVINNESAIRIGRVSRKQWLTRIYSFVSPDDTDELVNKPLSSTEDQYRLTRNFVIGAYALLTVTLIVSGIWQAQWSTEFASRGGAVQSSAPATTKRQVHSVRAQLSPLSKKK